MVAKAEELAENKKVCTCTDECAKGYNSKCTCELEECDCRDKKRRRRLWLLIFLMAIAFLVSFGLTYSFFVNRTPNVEEQHRFFRMPDGTIIRYDINESMYPYENGMVVIPRGGANITLACGDTIDVYESTVVKVSGYVIIPATGSKTSIDKFFHVTLPEGGRIILPDEDCTSIDVGPQTIVNPYSIIVDPENRDNLTVHETCGIITVGQGGARVITRDFREQHVSRNTMISPSGVIAIPRENTRISINQLCHIVMEGRGRVVLRDGEERDLPNGGIILPDGTIIEGTPGERPVIGDDGSITIPPGGKITYPNGETQTFPDCIIFVPGGTPRPCPVEPPAQPPVQPPVLPPVLSGDASLKFLGVTNQTLVPLFERDRVFYSLTVPYDVGTIVIEAEANHSRAVITPEHLGAKNLIIGVNVFEIRVTAENGATRSYIISVTRQEEEPSQHDKLAIAFTDGQKIEFPANSLPGTILAIKEFTVANSGNVCLTYFVYWTETINTFERQQDLQITVRINGEEIAKIQAPGANGRMVLPTGAQNLPPSGINSVHNYELVFEYLNPPGVNQNIDQGKMFSTVIQIADRALKC